MPHPDKIYDDEQYRNKMLETFAEVKKDLPQNEIVALRRDIAALMEMLAPVPSLIATGRDVIEEFKRLKGKK